MYVYDQKSSILLKIAFHLHHAFIPLPIFSIKILFPRCSDEFLTRFQTQLNISARRDILFLAVRR